MRFFITVSLLFSFLAAISQGGYYNFSKLTTSNGLSNNQVNAIYKDSDGFMWFGTMAGLNRYDGFAFKTFRKKTGDSSTLVHNNVLSLCGLPDDKMLVITRWVPCIYDFRTEKFDADCNRYLRQMGMPPGTIKTVLKGMQGRYWFLYDSLHLYKYTGKGGKAERLNIVFDQETKKITGIQESADAKLWVIFDNGLLQLYDIAIGKLLHSNKLLQKSDGANEYKLFIDRDGDLWIWTFTHGVYLLYTKTNTVKQFSEATVPALSSNHISQIAQDVNGKVWVATDHGGVTLIDKSNGCQTSFLLNNPNDPKSLSQNTVYAIYNDNNGIVWLGTHKQGINYIDAKIVQFPHYYYQTNDGKSLPYNDVNRFVEDKAGNIWIGTNGGGIIYFDRKANTFKQYLHNPADNSSLSNNVVVSMCMDHEGTLWVGTFLGGLNKFENGKFVHYLHYNSDTASVAIDNVWEIFEDQEKNLWIGAFGNGLFLFDKHAGNFRQFQPKGKVDGVVPLNFITRIIQDKKGGLWVGTVFGVAVISPDKKNIDYYNYTDDKAGLSNNSVTGILEDSKGRIWIGTREGLNLLDRQTKKIQVFTTSDGLPDNIISNIVEDDNHSIWLSTPSGLCNAIPLAKPGGQIGLNVISYDESNNVPIYNFNDNAALKTSKGELLFGGSAGFNIIDPQKIKEQEYQPKVVFTDLNILNKSIGTGETVNGRILLAQPLPKTQSISLKYKENVFSIEFTSLDFIHGHRDKYAYTLEGFNTGWLYADASQRRVTYTNLEPGLYIFKVKVLTANGAWGAEKMLEIRILPPLWRTWYAYLFYLVAAIGLLLLARKIVLDRIRLRFEMQQQKNEAERAHALDQLKTKFFTNVSHELRTPLTLILSPLDKIIRQSTDGDQKKALGLVHRNARRLLNLVNQLLDFRKIEVQGMVLHPSVGDIVAFVEDISHSFTDMAENKTIQLSFSANVPSLEVYFDKDKMEKILFNLLSNAFKYTYNNGAVGVRLEYAAPALPEAQGTIAIEVSDSGIGIPADKQERIFERFFQTDVPESMVNQGTGIGLAITKEFVRLHNGIIAVNSEPEKGTTFKVMIPAIKIRENMAVPDAMPPTIPEEPLEYGDIPKGSRKKMVLVVEDNEDLRFYLKDNLQANYLVQEATNGRDGWEMIKRLTPDLVVSDVAMPLMDGLELARKIKSDTVTAHIPVILLTAMGSEEKQLEGLSLGVNDYITKPFTFEILASRIRNLLAQQKLLQARFQKQIEINPAEVTITPVDEIFLKQALGLMEKQMGNAGYSVEDFSRDMLMSRVTFYRKILSITGKSPVEFMRSIRMKRAAQLLEKSGMTIGEIAYEVGFNNPKIFSKFFKEEFNVLPSQYGASKN